MLKFSGRVAFSMNIRNFRKSIRLILLLRAPSSILQMAMIWFAITPMT